MNKSRVVIVVTGILAMFQFLAGAAVLAEYVGVKPAGIFVLLVGAVQAGWAIIQQALVVPTGDVGAFVNSQGVMVAGPAAGPENGTPAAVVPNAGAVPPNQPGAGDAGQVDTRTIAIAALVIAVVVVLAIFVF